MTVFYGIFTGTNNSNPSPAASSEIPITAPFPPSGENCAMMGISLLPTATHSSPALVAGEAAEGGTYWARSWGGRDDAGSAV